MRASNILALAFECSLLVACGGPRAEVNEPEPVDTGAGHDETEAATGGSPRDLAAAAIDCE